MLRFGCVYLNYCEVRPGAYEGQSNAESSQRGTRGLRPDLLSFMSSRRRAA